MHPMPWMKGLALAGTKISQLLPSGRSLACQVSYKFSFHLVHYGITAHREESLAMSFVRASSIRHFRDGSIQSSLSDDENLSASFNFVVTKGLFCDISLYVLSLPRTGSCVMLSVKSEPIDDSVTCTLYLHDVTNYGMLEATWLMANGKVEI